MCYRATCTAASAVEEYVNNRGEWPNSWGDLEADYAAVGNQSPPQDGWDEIRTYVDINFSLTLDQVAGETIHNFDAITPNGVIWGGYEGAFERVLNIAQKKVQEKKR